MLKKIINFAARSKIHVAVLASAAVVCCGVTSTAQALPFKDISQVYFFGDSLTDSGYYDLFPETNPAKAPTFTTFGGYTWSQYIAHDIKGFPLPTYPSPPGVADTITNNSTPSNGSAPTTHDLFGVDYAAGGSTTNGDGNPPLTYAPSLHQQMTQFLSDAPFRLDPNAIYFVWSGANDILEVLPTLPANPVKKQRILLKTVKTAAANIGDTITALAARGAIRIVVMSLPNIGITPAIRLTGKANQSALQAVSFNFDSFLNQQLGQVSKTFPAVKILYFDTYSLLDNVVQSVKQRKSVSVSVSGQTHSFTFTNYKDPACGYFPSFPDFIPSIVCPSSSEALTGYVFADSVHPTNTAHRYLAYAVEAAIQNWS